MKAWSRPSVVAHCQKEAHQFGWSAKRSIERQGCHTEGRAAGNLIATLGSLDRRMPPVPHGIQDGTQDGIQDGMQEGFNLREPNIGFARSL